MRNWVGGACEGLEAWWPPSRSLLIGARWCSVRLARRRGRVRGSGLRTRRLARQSNRGWRGRARRAGSAARSPPDAHRNGGLGMPLGVRRRGQSSDALWRSTIPPKRSRRARESVGGALEISHVLGSSREQPRDARHDRRWIISGHPRSEVGRVENERTSRRRPSATTIIAACSSPMRAGSRSGTPVTCADRSVTKARSAGGTRLSRALPE
jgi:hypothetical protein